jgi:hypothetical protein
MDDYSSDEDYTYYDGSSTKTSLTPYSNDTTVGGSRIRREHHAFDRVEQACRTSCDVLRCLATTFSTVDGMDRDNLQPRRRHRLRIIDSNGREWKKPAVPTQTNEDRPIRWKNKGNSRMTVQESSSTDDSSMGSSRGREGREWEESSKKKKPLKTNKRTDQKEHNSDQLSRSDMELDGAVVKNPKLTNVSDFQTVDSRIIQRRRQQRQRGKKKDSVSFSFHDPHEVIHDDNPTRIHLLRNQQQLLEHHTLLPSHERVEGRIAAVGEAMKGISKSGNQVSVQSSTAGNVDTASSSSDHRGFRRKEKNDTNQETSEVVSGQAPAAYQTDKMPRTVFEQSSVHCQRENQNADNFDHRFGSAPQSNSNDTCRRRPHGLDGIVFHGLETQSNQTRDASPKNLDYLENAVEDRLNRSVSACKHENVSPISEPMVVDFSSQVAERDEFNVARDLKGHREVYSRINAEEGDGGTSSMVSSIHKSKLSKSEVKKTAMNRPPRSTPHAMPGSSSTLSLQSFNSDRYTKERWLRSRSSFDYNSGDLQLLSAGRERGATKGWKPWSTKKYSVSKAEASSDWSSASVVSVDRKARKRNINVRKEGEATSVM